jgi:hypothetical protein
MDHHIRVYEQSIGSRQVPLQCIAYIVSGMLETQRAILSKVLPFRRGETSRATYQKLLDKVAGRIRGTGIVHTERVHHTFDCCETAFDNLGFIPNHENQHNLHGASLSTEVVSPL